jgi:predicted MFS family arabinose efflux permease
MLISRSPEGSYELGNMLFFYGFISVAGAVLLLLFFRKEPVTTADNKIDSERINPVQGMKSIFRSTDMKLLLLMFFFGLGIFNAVSTCIDQICGSLTMEETGVVGGVMLFGGILGAIIIPLLSDRLQKRKPFLILCMALMIPGLLGLTFFTTFTTLAISAFAFGFFIMSAGPVGFQYGAEKSYPAPESTSQGLILLVGQISGILFVFGVNAIGIFPSMLIFISLIAVNVLLTLRISESYTSRQ